MRIFIIVLLSIVSLQATQLHWLDNYKEARSQAKKEHKLIYVFISSSSCGWCHKFERTILQDEAVKEKLKKEFITVHLIRDFDDVPKKFLTSPVPRHYFTDANGHILYDSLGYRKVDTFMAFMGYAEDQIHKKEK